jgi:hypothetical protein
MSKIISWSEFSQRYVKKIIVFFSSLQNNKIARFSINLVFLVFGILFFVKYLDQIAASLSSIDIQLIPIWSAFLITFLIVLVGGWVWWAILFGLGYKKPFWSIVHAQIRSGITRYTPGYIWQYVSKGYITHKLGVPEKTVGIGMVLEFVQLIWTGIGLAVMLFPKEVMHKLYINPNSIVLCRVIGLTILLVVPILIYSFLKIRKEIETFIPNIAAIIAAYFAVLCSWFGLGVVIGLISRGFGYSSDFPVQYNTFTIASSMVIGILIIPVPNGLGIREGVMAFLLSLRMPLTDAVVVSVTSRLLIFIAEVIWYFGLAVLKRN